MSDRGLFTRPVVIDDTNDDFFYGATPKVITNGTYGDIRSVAGELNIQLGVSFAVTFNVDFKVSIYNSSGVFSITWNDSQLRDLLGFTGDLSGADNYTATYTPSHIWFPDRVRADLQDWEYDHEANWRGEKTATGHTRGLVTGEDRFDLKAEYQAVSVWLVKRTMCRNAYETARCLDTFVKATRQSWGAVGQPSPAGFYYYPDYTQAHVHTSVRDNGSAETFNYTDSPSEYVFCAFDKDYKPGWDQTIDGQRTDYRQGEVLFHTADAPTWSQP